MDERIGARVPGETRFQAFLENFVELRLQGVNVADARRALRHPFGLLFFELEEVEIIAAVRDLFGAGEGLCRKRRRGKSRAEGRALFARR